MLRNSRGPLRLLIADQQDAVQATKECLYNSQLPLDINTVFDSPMLFDYLKADTKNLPQLILLELHLAGKNGLEVLAELKSNDLFRKIPVIIFSQSKASHDIEKSYELGASCFVNKPKTTVEWCGRFLVSAFR